MGTQVPSQTYCERAAEISFRSRKHSLLTTHRSRRLTGSVVEALSPISDLSHDRRRVDASRCSAERGQAVEARDAGSSICYSRSGVDLTREELAIVVWDRRRECGGGGKQRGRAEAEAEADERREARPLLHFV